MPADPHRSTVGSQKSIGNKAFMDVVRRASNIYDRSPSDLVKESDVALFVQSSSAENNAVQEVGFNDRRVYLAPLYEDLSSCSSCLDFN